MSKHRRRTSTRWMAITATTTMIVTSAGVGAVQRRVAAILSAAVLSTGLMLGLAAPANAGVDLNPPQVTSKGSQYVLGGQLSDISTNPSVPMRVFWSTYDPSGVCAQSVSLYHYDSETYTYPTVHQGKNNYFVNIYDRLSNDLSLRVYVRDCVGNSATRYVSVGYGSLTQETSALLSPGWTNSNCLCWSQGSVVSNNTAGAKASFTIYGDSVAWITNRAPNRGSARIYIDGDYQTTVNLQGDTINRIVGFSKRFARNAERTLDIVVVGTAGHARVDVDAIIN